MISIRIIFYCQVILIITHRVRSFALTRTRYIHIAKNIHTNIGRKITFMFRPIIRLYPGNIPGNTIFDYNVIGSCSIFNKSTGYVNKRIFYNDRTSSIT